VIRVAVADDHQLVREGIRAVFAQADDIDLIAEATSGEEAVEIAVNEKPDVLVMDITMPHLSGIEATSRIKGLGLATEVVILSMHSDPAVIREAMRVGARGYVLKGSVADELLLAIRSAHRGATYLTPLASETMLAEHVADDDPDRSNGHGLTDREREVLGLIGEGLTNRAIASKLDISIKTVERHRTNLMAKLDAHSIVELVRIGIRLGFIELDD
jgi:DNA-binding NarL/FixJ family response regulator